MRLWPILLTLFALAFAGSARATDYQVLWHQPDQATLVDVDSMRESGATRQAETLDLIWAADHPVAYRHRFEIDCAGKRARLLAARQVDLTTAASYVELKAPLATSTPRGWYGSELGNASGRLLNYMCRPTLAAQAKGLVRGSSPTEAVVAYARQWCDCGKDERLSKARWKVWRTAFDDLGLVRTRYGLEAVLWNLLPFGVLIGVPLLIHLSVVRLRRPLREGEARVANFIVSTAWISLAASAGIAWAGSYAWQGQELPITLLVLTFAVGGLALLPYWLCFRLQITEEGFTYRDYWRRSSTWRWSDVEAVGVREFMRQLHLRMAGGRVLKLPIDLEGMDAFFPHIEKAKGWGEGGPVEPVTF